MEHQEDQLKRVLNLWDLVLFHITAIVGVRWLAVAAENGYTSITLWTTAFFFFFIPQAFVVLRLTRKWPVEGGLYEWTKRTYGPFHGFVSGWCYWANNIIYYPTLLTVAAGFATYMFGKRFIHLENSPVYIMGFSIIALWIILGLNIIGLDIGRWVQNVGGLSTWVTTGLVILFGGVYLAKFGSATPWSLSELIPKFSFETFNFWSYLCFAFAGFELISLMSGEVKNPERNIPRSILIAGTIATVIYILGTLSLIISIPKEETHLITGILQALSHQTDVFNIPFLTSIVAFFLVLSHSGGVGAWLTGSGRILYVVGVDKYFPPMFSKIHPRWRTPHIALITQGILSTFFIILSGLGSTVEQFYKLLLDFTVIIYFIPYIYLFASYITLTQRNELHLSKIGVLLAAMGLLSTTVAILFSFSPLSTAVTLSEKLFHISKVIFGSLFMIGLGLVFYWRAERKSSP